ncbi:unnamed protein product [Lactuca saligna]|uniref:ABC transporter domain-containing protein n=1 Tax=Lactuca saligna TaxID=75948 RepID=A0AA35UZ78_LACSI|nr:unnamed protein product [Lactuca saligna]
MWDSLGNLFVRTQDNDDEALKLAALQSKLDAEEKKVVLDKLVHTVNSNPGLFFDRIRQRFDNVDLKFPKVEVRFENLEIDAFIHVGSRALPTLPNSVYNMSEAFLKKLRIFPGRRKKLSILNDVSGIIRPSRLTLLLGPPSSGKTTLLLALAGRLGNGLKLSGKITYNGHELKEFVPQRTSSYVSQKDCHMAEMTVRETLQFAESCQGFGYKQDMIMELLRREKNAGIRPDEDLDIFIKTVALGEDKTSLVVEYLIKILGLDICTDTLVGDEMRKGISGGQMKRLTSGELLVGPSRVLFMDEISTGLDSSTTYQIIKYLKHSTRALDGTAVISLLQPDPETFELFDDLILLCEGQIVYQGPRNAALGFFASMGFHCPKRKNVADFLQEVTSVKDQEQYWALDEHYTLSTSTYGVNRMKLLKISFSWQMLLLKRDSFVYIFKYFQLMLVVIIMTSVFFRTTMHHNSLEDGGVYLGALYFAIVMILFNGFMEVPMLIAKLPVIYKHRDLHFYPCWVYTLPSWILSIPSSIIESGVWVIVTYYLVGFDPQFSRCLKQFGLYFSLHQMSIGLFRMMGSLGRNMIVANTFGSFAMLVVMALGGFILSRDSIPAWWIWGYWVSPLMYAQNAVSVNEFLGDTWDKASGNNTNIPLGALLLKVRSLFREDYWYWIGIGALLGYTILFNILFTLFLTYLNPIGNQQVVIPRENTKSQKKRNGLVSAIIELKGYLQCSPSYPDTEVKNQRGMVLPFQALTMTFRNISYYVDIPGELKQQGLSNDKLQLLVNVTGAFRPGVLTALVGVSGAGKTTLMDVLAGRKTGGHISGQVFVSGYPKNQETFARVSGYCEQNDVHSPCLTVHEALIFSAWLRLPSDINMETRREFVEEVMELVELNPLKVANPSIVFMDEPTSGLDARAAAIVMRTVRNIVNTGRTIVCTIHQPSIDIFESFDELLLMKHGGKLIYAGPLGTGSHKVIQFFQGVKGVSKIRSGYNPAAWILEATSTTEENRLGVDFAQVYRQSDLYLQNQELVDNLSKPDRNSRLLTFPTKYSQTFLGQFFACLWKQNLSYWRNPQYTAVRFFYTVIISLMFGTMCWKFGTKRETQQDIFNAMGSMYAAVLFIGITNASSVQPVIYVERSVSYRERAAGMYSALPFAFAQVAIEFPYVYVQSLVYSVIFYYLASFEWNMMKLFWYVYFMFFTLLYFTFFGMMTIAVTPNHNIAAIVAAPFYMLWNLFSGFMVVRMRIPIWWRWYYWANPVAWSLYGLLTSQYGDVDDLLKLADGSHSVPLKQFLEDQFGYRHEFLGVAATAVVGFCLLFALVFAFTMKSFNFQRR